MSMQRQLLFWGIGLFVFVLMLWLLKSILLPFVAGLAVAYLLDPFADWLEESGLSRLMATVVITIFFVLLVVLFFLLLVPLLYDQTVAFVENLPALVQRVQEWLAALSEGTFGRFIQGNDAIREKLDAAGSDIASWALSALGEIWRQSMAVVGLISLVVVTPIVAFYMLLDWDRMVARIDDLLPRDHTETIRGLFREMDLVLAGFVRGQGTVCLLLGTFYAVGLSLAGLNFGLVVGLGAGLISFIPYVGTITGFVVSILLAILQYGPQDYVSIGIVAGIFVVGQFIEGNFLTPKLVGDRVGLHPVWVMFALFAFGVLFGFVGLLLAVPIAAAIGVLARFGVRSYVASPLYRGSGPPQERQ
ncbi:AI-2E family transporter [Tepidicaulis sp. LMO-SS28]|uniref:AI-2E family transporter n=1 Tax=Tepidicaulis sp. LMO-SS28 TaxID=3447455 RepID=UPI003EE39541